MKMSSEKAGLIIAAAAFAIAAAFIAAGDVQASVISPTQPVFGGTGTSQKPTLGQVLVGTAGGVYTPQATSTLGISSGSSLPISIANGGTGSTTAPISQLLYGGASSYQSVGTTSATLGLGLSGTLTTVNNTSQSLSVATSSFYTGTIGQVPYFSGNNQLVGTSTINIATSGNVGIGSSSPTSQLSIFAGGDFLAHPLTRLFSVSSSSIGVATSTLFTVTSNGRVGIGTANPSQVLEVNGATLFDQSANLSAGATVGVGGIQMSTGGNGFYNQTANFFIQAQSTGGVAIITSPAVDADLFNPKSFANGFGSSSPTAEVSVFGGFDYGSHAAHSLFNVGSSTVGTATTSLFDVHSSGNITLNSIIYASCTALTTNAAGLLGCTPSDQNVKQDIQSLDGSSMLAATLSLNPVSYEYKEGVFATNQVERFGLVAQQVQAVFPTLVSTTSPTKYTPKGTLQVDYIQFIGIFIADLKEIVGRQNTQQQEIDQLKAQVAQLETQHLSMCEFSP